jgi:hypothetical protein
MNTTYFTLEEFLELLRDNAKPGDFEINSSGEIRSRDRRCPLCWLATILELNPGNYYVVPQKTKFKLYQKDLNIYSSTVDHIADEFYDPGFRYAVIQACKLARDYNIPFLRKA